jgi:hypothetical protein
VVGKRVCRRDGLDHSSGLLNSVRASTGWSEQSVSKAWASSESMSRLTRDVFRDESADAACVLFLALLEMVFPIF